MRFSVMIWPHSAAAIDPVVKLAQVAEEEGYDTVYIGGTLVGNGPVVRRALAPRKEPYEIRVVLRGEERVRFVAIQPGRMTRVRIAPPWQR